MTRLTSALAAMALVALAACSSGGTTSSRSSAPVLAYGQRTRPGSILCESAEAGVTCTHQRNGHGFFVSRERYQLF